MSDSDSWATPQALFDELNQEFNFSIDLCATASNSKCDVFGYNYLKNEYYHATNNKHIYTMGGLFGAIREFYDYEYEATCFMNPPYSNPKPFIEKAWEDSKHCKIVCLVPNTIKTCKYIDILDKNQGTGSFRDWKNGIEIRDLARRTKFTHPSKKESSPSFGCMLIIMDRRGLS